MIGFSGRSPTWDIMSPIKRSATVLHRHGIPPAPERKRTTNKSTLPFIAKLTGYLSDLVASAQPIILAWPALLGPPGRFAFVRFGGS